MKTLVFSEKSATAFELISKAVELSRGQKVAALVCGDGNDVYFRFGADTLYSLDTTSSDLLEEDCADVLNDLVRQQGFELILLDSTKKGREIASRLATRLGAGCVTDVIDLRYEGSSLLADRYSLGGNSIATEEVLTPVKVYAVMPYAFKKQESGASSGEKVQISLQGAGSAKKVVERQQKKREGVKLEEAERIVAVGKGLEKEEDLELVRELAKAISAEVGCSRALAMDYHWLTEDRVVGLTGIKVSPKLYLAIGISGQIQHMVGVTRAKTIVAINKASDAPIFKVSDYGIVGDLYEVVPKMIEQLKKG